MRTRLFLFLSATILTLASTLLAEPKLPLLRKVYVAPDGLAHIVDLRGNDLAMAKENEQVGVSAPKLSPDKQTAGWLVQQENCCTSYTTFVLDGGCRSGTERPTRPVRLGVKTSNSDAHFD